ncbi:MAG: Fur family transcriptional regulator [Candidatus Hinthialibacter sp.]
MKKQTESDIEKRLEEFSQLCRKNNLRVTHQRIEIFRALLETVGHPTVEDVFQQIRTILPALSIDTVYRTLTLFENHGLITRVQCLSDKGRFDPNLEDHHHFICMRCKKIEDFHWPEFADFNIPAEAEKLGMIQMKKVELRGICNECLKKEKKKNSPKKES